MNRSPDIVMAGVREKIDILRHGDFPPQGLVGELIEDLLALEISGQLEECEEYLRITFGGRA